LRGAGRLKERLIMAKFMTIGYGGREGYAIAPTSQFAMSRMLMTNDFAKWAS